MAVEGEYVGAFGATSPGPGGRQGDSDLPAALAAHILLELKAIGAVQQRMESMLIQLQQEHADSVRKSVELCTLTADQAKARRQVRIMAADAPADGQSLRQSVESLAEDPEQPEVRRHAHIAEADTPADAPAGDSSDEDSGPRPPAHGSKASPRRTAAPGRQSSAPTPVAGKCVNAVSAGDFSPQYAHAQSDSMLCVRATMVAPPVEPTTSLQQGQSSSSVQSGRASPKEAKRSSRSESSFGLGCAAEELFIAATLPASWPRVLEARCVCHDRSRTVVPMIMNIMSSEQSDFRKAPARNKHLSDCELPSQPYFIMAPGSPVHMVFCAMSFVVLLFDFTVIPVTVAWDLKQGDFFYAASWFSVLFWACDIGVTFITAFYERGELTFQPAAIARRYLRTWFSVDVLALCADAASIVLQSVLEGSASPGLRSVRLLKVARLLRVMGILRMLRFTTVIRDYVDKQCSHYGRFSMKTASMLFGILLLTHAMGCAWFALGKLGPADTGARWTDEFFKQDSGHNQIFSYQYLTSFRWAAGHMTLGGSEVDGLNSLERLFEIVCMHVGLIFNCVLVSSLSATLVDFQMAHKDQREKLDSLRRYMKENCVSTTTRMLVQDQVTERLREEKSARQVGEVAVLKLLSNQLYSKVRFEVFWPTISSHPLLQLWSYMHLPTMQKLCVEVLDYRFLAGGDDLFRPGSKAEEAFRVESGELEYTQFQDSSPVLMTTTKGVAEGSWMCEAALWSHWIHVGAAVAAERSNLVAIKAEGVLRVCREHLAVESIVTSYGETFHRRLVQSSPPDYDWPNDLQVPRTTFAEIVIGMHSEVQMAVSLQVLRQCRQHAVFSSWKKALSGTGRHLRFDELEEDVVNGKTILVQSGADDIERIAVVTCLCIRNQQGEVLVQIAQQDAGGIMHAVCQLPGQQLDDELSASDRLQEVLESRLPHLAGKVELVSADREIRKAHSPRLAMMTTYIRTIINAKLLGEWVLPPMARYASQDPEVVQKASKFSKAPVHRMSGRGMDLPSFDTFEVIEQDGKVGLHCWLAEETYAHIMTSDADADRVREWVESQLGTVLDYSRLTKGRTGSCLLDYDGPLETRRCAESRRHATLAPLQDWQELFTVKSVSTKI